MEEQKSDVSLNDYISHVRNQYGDQKIVTDYYKLIESKNVILAANATLQKELIKKERFRKKLAQDRAYLFNKVKDYKKVISFLSKQL
jgi:hypothetical protein